MGLLGRPPRSLSLGATTRVLLYGFCVQFGWLALAGLTWIASFEPTPGRAAVIGGLLGLLPVLLIGLGLKENLRFLHLLRHGVLAPGRLVKKWKVVKRSRRGTHTAWYYKFEYPGPEGQLCAETVSSFEWPLEELTDDPFEAVLYDPASPSEAVLLDQFHGGVIVARHGRVGTRSPLAPLLAALPLGIFLSVLASVLWKLI